MILLLRPPRRSPLLPYTTLFRSGRLTLGPATGSLPVQVGFDELGLPLSEVTFVVVDLETTGGSATRDAITEVGAVKVRGGEVLGERSEERRVGKECRAGWWRYGRRKERVGSEGCAQSDE